MRKRATCAAGACWTSVAARVDSRRLLVETYGCKVWGVDPEPKMIEVARERVPPGVGLKIGRAEDLPFKDGWFERVTMTLVLQLVDRPRAYREALRVLEPGGRLALATFDYAHFERYFLGGFFPSFEAVDKERFPSAAELEQELSAAGFRAVRLTRLTQREIVERETVLERIRGKHISTFQLISDEEYRVGARAGGARAPGGGRERAGVDRRRRRVLAALPRRLSSFHRRSRTSEPPATLPADTQAPLTRSSEAGKESRMTHAPARTRPSTSVRP